MSEIIDFSANVVNCGGLDVTYNEVIDENLNIFTNKAMVTSLCVNNTNVYLAMIKLMLQLSAQNKNNCTYRLDLSYLDFQGMDFSNTDFSYCNLTGVNFAGANLKSSDLSRCNLTGVNFSSANLTSVTISRSIITGIVGIGAVTTSMISTSTTGTPAVAFGGSLSAGLTYNGYNGYFNDNITYANSATARTGFSATSTATVTDLSNLEVSTDGNFVDGSGQTTFTTTWRGYFYANVSGTYEFSLASDDASWFWLNVHSSLRSKTNATIDNSTQHPVVTKTTKVNLLEGCYYPLFIIYGQNLGGYSCEFTFTPPASASELEGEVDWYYH